MRGNGVERSAYLRGRGVDRSAYLRGRGVDSSAYLTGIGVDREVSGQRKFSVGTRFLIILSYLKIITYPALIYDLLPTF